MGQGPSPRVRGIRREGDRRVVRHGSIPAGAGNPPTESSRRAGRRVHPRGCGESSFKLPPTKQVEGPSPRVRGIRCRTAFSGRRRGSIPAGAGNPIRRQATTVSSRVHPRGCGESTATTRCAYHRRGPSPRVRGIREDRIQKIQNHRSIPAGAGNPSRSRRPDLASRVHPRGCGESRDRSGVRVHRQGPSPRVRGIRVLVGERGVSSWSIPAGAGNPCRDGTAAPSAPVHPRGCGESNADGNPFRHSMGPSPRVRGIRRRLRPPGRSRGSIPAGAGNPSPTGGSRETTGVHPRGCGESRDMAALMPLAGGPSPRVRGIPCEGVRRLDDPGSIPAGAGNPPPACLP